MGAGWQISTHTPLAGRDIFWMRLRKSTGISTHTPLAGRDYSAHSFIPMMAISTHTPLAGRDSDILDESRVKWHFYSHAPRGARLSRYSNGTLVKLFLLTRPSRGATGSTSCNLFCIQFLLTRPSRGATLFRYNALAFCQFLLTRPSRGATAIY